MADESIPSVADARALNQGFLQMLREGPEGIQKAANTINEEIILSILREDGISRRMLLFEPVSSAQLSTDPQNPDIPVMYIPIEAQFNEYLATAVDFMQPSKDLWFRSKVGAIYFKPIKTKTVRLHEGQLLANNYPIRTYVESVMKNDLLAVEDIYLINAIERCVAKNAADNSLVQAGPLNKDVVADASKAMIRNRLALVTIATNEITYQDVIKWNATEVGSAVMEDIVDFGAKGEEMRYKSWLGYKWVLTNNTDVIAEGVLYYLPAQKYLGVAKMLAEAEQWLEFRDGILSTNTREIIGRNLVNAKGPIKQRLT